MAAREEDEDRVLTIPNVLSIGRLLCAPIFLWLLFGRENRAAAATLLGVLGVTDFVDGYIARHFNQVSKLGKVLDPVADRILLLVGVIGILIDGSVPVWVAVAALAREALLSVVVLAMAAMGARRIDVQWVGKAGTFALMVSFPLFLASESTVSWRDFAGNLAWAFAIPGLVLSYYAAFTYLPMAKRALADGRLDRASLRSTGTGTATGTGTGTDASGKAVSA